MWSCRATSGEILFFSASAAVRNRSTTSSEVLADTGDMSDRCDFLLPRGLLGGGWSAMTSSGPESVIVLSLSEASAFESDSVALSVFSESPSLCCVGEGLGGAFLLGSEGGALRDWLLRCCFSAFCRERGKGSYTYIVKDR